MSALFSDIRELHAARPVNAVVSQAAVSCSAIPVASWRNLTSWIKHILIFIWFFCLQSIYHLQSCCVFSKYFISKQKQAQRNGSACKWKEMIKTSNLSLSSLPRISPCLYEYWEKVLETSNRTEKIFCCWRCCQDFSTKKKKNERKSFYQNKKYL